MSHLVIQIKTRAGLPDEVEFRDSEALNPFLVVKAIEAGDPHFVSFVTQTNGDRVALHGLHSFSEEHGPQSFEGYRTTVKTLWRTVRGTIMPDVYATWAAAFVQKAADQARAMMPEPAVV